MFAREAFENERHWRRRCRTRFSSQEKLPSLTDTAELYMEQGLPATVRRGRYLKR